MENLVSTPDFDGLPSLQKLELYSCDKLEEIHPSLGNHKKLENLHIVSAHWNFQFPEIQSDMENLVRLFLFGFSTQVFLSSVAVHCPNLVKLSLYGSNHLSKSNFNLSQLTVLVHLDLSCCNWLEKLPEFPPSLAIFTADRCKRLTDVGDSIRNCKWLCQVSVRKGGILNDGERLLQSMLQGKAIENHSMVLRIEGLQIPKEFRPRLRAGAKCTLQLPDNWCNDFCGFLMCAVLKDDLLLLDPKITMKQVRGGSMGMLSEDDVDWKESGDDKRTWVGYVSFGSLRHSVAWFDETCKAVSFSITIKGTFKELCSGFGVSLVPRTSGSGPTDTSPPEYYHEFHKKKYDFKPEFKIQDDLSCTFWIPSVTYQ